MRGGLGWGQGEGVTCPPSLNSHLDATCRKISTETHNSRDFRKIIILSLSLDLDRAGSVTLQKYQRRDRDRDCSKFESYRQYRDSNMNPKKKQRRYRFSFAIHALELAIYRFIHSFVQNILYRPLTVSRMESSIFHFSWQMIPVEFYEHHRVTQMHSHVCVHLMKQDANVNIL